MRSNILKNTLLFALLALPLMLFACNDDESSPDISFGTDDPYFIGKEEGATGSIEVLCSGSWETSLLIVDQEDEEWIWITDGESGNGNGTVKLAVKENPGGNRRSAALRIVAGTNVQSITIYQKSKAFNPAFRSPTLLYTAAELVEIKNAVAAADANSTLKGAYNDLIARCDKAASAAVPAAYTGASNVEFHAAFLAVGGATRDLALGYALTGKEAYAAKAVAILDEWSSKCKAIHYNKAEGGEETEESGFTGAGMRLSRSMFPALCAYDILRNTEGLFTAAQTANIEAWLRNLHKHNVESAEIWETQDYFNKQYWQNHLVAHTMGSLAAGYVLQDESMIQWALDSDENPRDLYELLEGCIFMAGDEPCHREVGRPGYTPPQTGEIYDRYRHFTATTKGLQYAHLTNSLLTTSARICYNNGIDLFAYKVPTGEQLLLCHEFYSVFYRENDASLQGGYYVSGGFNEQPRLSKAGDNHGLFETAVKYYPESETLQAFLARAQQGGVYNRALDYNELFGHFRFYSVAVDKTH